jgi:transcriptional regulator with XRE-family HTH domain
LIDPTDVDVPSPTLQQLIRSRMDSQGWSYSDLERRSGQALSRGRWQQLGSGAEQKKFPDPASLLVIAQVLEIDITTVVLAAARAVGLAVTPDGGDLAHLLPPGTERLSGRMREAILMVIRAGVTESSGEQAAPSADHPGGPLLEWPKSAAPSRRHRNGPAQGG